MKKIAISILCMLCSMISYAQFTTQNTFLRTALARYVIDDNGFWQAETNVPVERVDNIEKYYAYDKKKHFLYVKTNDGNYCVHLLDDLAKQYKKQKIAPMFDNQSITAEIEITNAELAEKYRVLNKQRQDELDEIEKKRKIEEEKKRREEEEHNLQLVQYRSTHEWRIVPFPKYISCTQSECSHMTNTDNIFVFKIQNDTVYSYESEELGLDYKYNKIHTYKINGIVKSNKAFSKHYEAFADSLQCDGLHMDQELVDYMNYQSANECLNKLKKDIPYGYVADWGWDDEYGMISFNIEYVNTNAKTIKYIQYFWKVTNDVGDVRKTGYFQGTGPVEQYHSGSWDWDSSSYYVAGDASNMEITKIVITYMNGTKVTLGQNQIYYK